MSQQTEIVRNLQPGRNFYLREYPGNAYRYLGANKAEFTAHRSNPEFRGCVITMGAAQEIDLVPGLQLPRTNHPAFLPPAPKPKCLLCGAPCSDELCVPCGGDEPEQDWNHLL